MKFKQLCLGMSVDKCIQIDPDNIVYPDSFNHMIDVIVGQIYPRKDVLDKVEFPFIEKTFSVYSKADIQKILDEVCNSDIPDGVLHAFAVRIFDKPFNELELSEQAIINVLSVYLIIQIYNFRRN